ncbi:hypothetical protein DBR32_05350 [Taibaiella sp. KBW10]|uniref:SprT-like domain-containing protein n=1 Tax=Taibaiella sp. KBW10 TaxID=2153357 RepID=UPI000F59AD92|nr:SprT-like domain-containing protein [Taibaiella sp. KBW10]RQO31390.1 hypothetical protein DBR32_05350 [Taibaiella sp. KBW10]
MAKEKLTFDSFGKYLPQGTLEKVIPWFKKYTIQLIITRERRSILGNYRQPIPSHPFHRVTVNGNLNAYAFLITLLHELAHLEAYVQFKNRIAPHGKEWQDIYKNILVEYLGKNLFPADLEKSLHTSLKNLKASSCADPKLYKALMAFDEPLIEGLVLVEALIPNTRFVTKEGRVFLLLQKRRTRYLCKEIKTNKDYLFSGLVQVKPLVEPA